MQYYELKILFSEVIDEEEMGIYISDLGDIGFESFTNDDDSLCGYINETEYLANQDALKDYCKLCSDKGLKTTLTLTEQQNWNALWESNFEPIFVGDRCVIRAPFHDAVECECEVVIMPKMSFGTGHHATTYLMSEKILDSDLSGLSGLDMGSGTGVLAIIAAKRGASSLDAIDIDEWAAENCRENIEANGVEDRVVALLGDASVIPDKRYDFILANINRNILLSDMHTYIEHLAESGNIFFSGFLAVDVDDIVERGEQLGLQHVETRSKDGWQMVQLSKR